MPRVVSIFLWASALSVALLSFRVLIAPMNLVMDHMVHYGASAPIAMWGHLLFGPLALAVIPFQTWAALRHRRPAVHRWLGRVYAVSVIIAGMSSLALLPHFLGQIWVATGFMVLAVLWMATTAVAVRAAWQGRVAAHRRWMLRSAAFCFAAVSLRIIMAPLMAAGWSVIETYQITAWGSWIVTGTAVEFWLQRRP